MVGVSLLNAETGLKVVSDMLVTQIGRRGLGDKATEREIYATSAGLALGIVNLQKTGQTELDERLLRFIEGGAPMDVPLSVMQAAANSEQQVSSCIKEGDMVNVHVTAPGAIMALALIH